MNKDKARGVVRKFAKQKHILQCQNNYSKKKCEAVIMDRVMYSLKNRPFFSCLASNLAFN